MLSTLVALVLSQAAGADLPADFAVRIQYGTCYHESLDSAADTFSRTIRPGTVRRETLGLSPVQRRQLFDLVRSVDLFDYPQHFEPVVPTLSELPREYSIEIRSAGRRHVVQWVDHGSTDPASARLRAMLLAAQAWVAALPAVQRVPPSEMICL